MDRLEDKNKVVFIIAHKYFRGYESYVEYYIKSIRGFYENSLILVVDNNSIYKKDIFDKIKNYDNVILLDNDIECKFELGAYQVGLRYLIENNLLDKYSYIAMTQDNFIIKNKLDFNVLAQNEVTARPLNSYYQDGSEAQTCQKVLSQLGLYNNLGKITFCWCNSFIVSTSKVKQLYNYLKQIIITVRSESCASERYMARILWELNERKNSDIDGDIRDLQTKYYWWTVDLYGKVNSYFAKRVQCKNEHTKDK